MPEGERGREWWAVEGGVECAVAPAMYVDESSPVDEWVALCGGVGRLPGCGVLDEAEVVVGVAYDYSAEVYPPGYWPWLSGEQLEVDAELCVDVELVFVLVLAVSHGKG